MCFIVLLVSSGFVRPLVFTGAGADEQRPFPGVNVEDHFTRRGEMVPLGSGAYREVRDIRLTRLACWAVSLSADGKRSGVAEAKRYFMESTRAMEILRDNPALSRKIRKWSALGRDWDWIDKRYKGQFVRRAHTEALKEAGVMPGYGHATCADTINLEVLGQPARKIREERGVKDTRDGLDHVEVVSIMFAETMATRRIERHQSRGIQACKADCKVAGENTRRALDDSLAPRSIA